MSKRQCTVCLDLPAKMSVQAGGGSSSSAYLNARVALVVASLCYLDDVEVPANRVRLKPREEFLGDRMSELEQVCD